MKKVLLMAIFGLFAFGAIGQEQIVVNESDLTPDQLAKIKARNQVETVTEQLETYGEYAGMGKEIGVAINDGLSAVKDVTIDFADSDVGKFTMFLIAWKVIGDDVKGFVIGIPLWILLTGIFIWAYHKTCLERRVLSKQEGGFWIFGGTKEYEIVPAMTKDWENGAPQAIIFIIWVIFTGIMFGIVIF